MTLNVPASSLVKGAFDNALKYLCRASLEVRQVRGGLSPSLPNGLRGSKWPGQILPLLQYGATSRVIGVSAPL